MPDHPIENDPRFHKLQSIIGTVSDLYAAGGVLGWDQRTYMPEAAGEQRAQQLATLSRLAHEHITSDEVGRLLEELAAEVADLDSWDDAPSFIRVAKRDFEDATKLPSAFVARFSQVTSLAESAWEKAKAEADFSKFRDRLQEVVDLTIERAELLGYATHRYDALLDQYEPDTKAETVEQVFGELKAALVPMIRAIGERPPVDDAFLFQDFDRQKQWDFGLEILKAIGYDIDRGRQDYSAHPFTIDLGVHDVRITTFAGPDLKPALWATIHEGGHGIHSQGTPERFARTPIDGSPGLGISESQSRLFENVVGRSKPFWAHHLPRLQSFFPEQLSKVDLDTFYRAINKVEPSLIRVEADEVTYHLHIMLRFELEKALVEEKLAVRDLPEAWNEKMRAYLGVTPSNDGEGVLQDVHWSMGAIGYFPTYSLGSLLAVHLYNIAVAERPEIADELAQGTCASLRGWLGERVYSLGGKLTPPQLVEHVTGGPLTAKPFVAYAKKKYGEIYGI